jgi:hypothetical protein
VKTKTIVAGSGFHWITTFAASVPPAGTCALPKLAAITELKSSPWIVKPVTVVATPAISLSWINAPHPGCGAADFGVTFATTFEPVGPATVTATVPYEAPKVLAPA